MLQHIIRVITIVTASTCKRPVTVHVNLHIAAAAAVGSANDRVAIQRTPLYELMNKMAEGYVVIGDAAYEPTERLVPLYYGAKRSDPAVRQF